MPKRAKAFLCRSLLTVTDLFVGINILIPHDYFTNTFVEREQKDKPSQTPTPLKQCFTKV